jgi:hypothetical protein
MSEYHRTCQLTVTGAQPEVEKLWNGRFRQVFFCDSKDSDNTDFESIERILPEFGTLSSAPLAYNPSSPDDREAYPDMRLTKAENQYIPSAAKHMVVLTYETITDAFVAEKDDDTDNELNGLRRVSRASIATIETEYTGEVGVTTESSVVVGQPTVTLHLADFKIDDTDAYRRVVETWMERGVLSKGENQGPADIPNSKQHVWESFGDEPVSMPGIIIGKLKSDILGYITYRYTSISNAADGDPTDGILSTYHENISIKKPGLAEIKTITPNFLPIGSSGEIAYVKTTPPTVGKGEATVTVEITTVSSVDAPVAYNLEDVAVSATIVNLRWTPISQVNDGEAVSAYNSASVSVDQNALHNYAKATEPDEYVESSLETGGVSIGVSQKVQYNNKEITLSGSGPVPTTGIYDSNTVPIFLGLDGTQYYRKTTYTLT